MSYWRRLMMSRRFIIIAIGILVIYVTFCAIATFITWLLTANVWTVGLGVHAYVAVAAFTVLVGIALILNMITLILTIIEGTK